MCNIRKIKEDTKMIKQFKKPIIEVVELEDDTIIVCSGGQGQYGPDNPVVDPDDPGFWD